MLNRRTSTFQLGKDSCPTRAGTATVEFAFVVPIFLFCVFTCIEFCRLNMIRNLVQDAAYFASRRCIVPGATADEAIAEANRILGIMGTRGAVININNGQPLNESSSEVIVNISVPIASNALLAPKFLAAANFEASAVMKTERYDGFFQANP